VLRCDATGLFERCKLSLGQHQAILGAPNAPYLPERNYRRRRFQQGECRSLCGERAADHRANKGVARWAGVTTFSYQPDLNVTCCEDDLNPRPLMARERLA